MMTFAEVCYWSWRGWSGTGMDFDLLTTLGCCSPTALESFSSLLKELSLTLSQHLPLQSIVSQLIAPSRYFQSFSTAFNSRFTLIIPWEFSHWQWCITSGFTPSTLLVVRLWYGFRVSVLRVDVQGHVWFSLRFGLASTSVWCPGAVTTYRIWVWGRSMFTRNIASDRVNKFSWVVILFGQTGGDLWLWCTMRRVLTGGGHLIRGLAKIREGFGLLREG